ncbi:Fic family protein [Turneriella parva]|uniref:Filamentation induced by cAMP protein Fic n=1 Tax=Turneriella parva (strain ATCC BAA-1111 / DSM 21527 / NCTC 11395 / H) TaxID=869212 RepID=I4B1R4_TURPD|nr:Fic family protein [Turneriella parva]AFM11221.1 filamentation induced by cAMP protein Fic [Turneriella parva DSM 21527]
MAYEPFFTITPKLLSLVESVVALRERIQLSTVELAWIPALQRESRDRNVHASTAIEGNTLTLAQVSKLGEGKKLVINDQRGEREVLNYFAGLRHVEKQMRKKTIRHEDIFRLHQVLAQGVMDQGEAGRYRSIAVRVGDYMPPAPQDVSGLMFELLDWWNTRSRELSPILSSAILHYRFESIHPFADGNGRTGRSLALWELFRRGFDTHHIFSVDEYYWSDRPAYYAALNAVRHDGEDLTSWLVYATEGLRQTLEQVWVRVKALQHKSPKKLILRPKQEKLLALLRDHGSMAPAELWSALKVSRQGAMDLLRPLLKAGLVKKEGNKKVGRYRLHRP